MATALDLITRSMRLAKILGTNEEPTAQEATDALSSLNSLLEAWSLERLLIHYVLRTTKTLTSGVATYTVGTGGDINITYPPFVEDSSYVTLDGGDYALKLLDEQSYRRISLKTATGIPEFLFYDKQYPLARVVLYPTPNAAYVLNFASWAPLQTFATLTTELALPLGYKRMIEMNLAVELAPEYGLDAPDRVAIAASMSKTAVKRINAPDHVLRVETAMITSPFSAGINSIYG